MKTFRIHCFSDIRKEYVVSAHPPFFSIQAARAYGNEHIKNTDFIVLPD